jgi:hypothetical protein
MKLQLRDAGIAEVYGYPRRDCEYADLIAVMTVQGWDKSAAQAHADAAIRAGAYTIDETPSAAKPKPRRTIDLTDSAGNTESARNERDSNARKE